VKFKLLASILLVGCSLACAPALYACQKCIQGGVTDPSGGVSDKARCYSTDSGYYELCKPNDAGTGCDMDDTDPAACPIPSGSGSSGGGIYDLSDGFYQPGSGGYCSAEYAICH